MYYLFVTFLNNFVFGVSPDGQMLPVVSDNQLGHLTEKKSNSTLLLVNSSHNLISFSGDKQLHRQRIRGNEILAGQQGPTNLLDESVIVDLDVDVYRGAWESFKHVSQQRDTLVISSFTVAL